MDEIPAIDLEPCYITRRCIRNRGDVGYTVIGVSKKVPLARKKIVFRMTRDQYGSFRICQVGIVVYSTKIDSEVMLLDSEQGIDVGATRKWSFEEIWIRKEIAANRRYRMSTEQRQQYQEALDKRLERKFKCRSLKRKPIRQDV